MTSEHAVDGVLAVPTEEHPSKADEQLEPLAAPPADEPEPVKTEGEGEGEKPKRAVRKKRESAAAAEAMDTQPLFEQPIILEGKRSRKPTSRLELSDLSPPKKELSIPQGHGKPLGEIEYINYQITHASTDALSHMRNVCFGRRASKTNIQQTLREFNGFEFAKDSEDYQRHLSNLNKLKKDQLRSISDILGLPAEGRNDEHAERILAFLMNPVDEGKAIPERKMSTRAPKSTRISSKESIHTDEEDEENDNEQDEDYADELFNEEEEEEAADTDDDYIGSDDDYGLHSRDDPDDFVYQPGKKTPKKKPSLKRSRSGTAQKRKRNPPRTAQRGRKKPKVADVPTAKDDNLVASTEPAPATEQVVDQPPAEPQTSDPTPAPSDQHDTTTNKSDSDMIPATS